MTSASGVAQARSDVAGVGYRAHLDGLRAVAVYLVVVFHAGSGRLTGGFIGVDVFFVLSGYLVTQLLVRDLEGSGAIGYRRFYSRRLRRLLPAAAVVIVVTAVVYQVIASPVDLLAARDAVRSASLYYSNWFFIGQSTDYFGADVRSSPVLHFWSLSVEEQYYLAWPLLLGGLHLLTRRAGDRQRAVMGALVAAALLVLLLRTLRMSPADLNHAYYGTDTRAYQLLAGSLLALLPGSITRLARSSRGGVRRATSLTSWGALGVLCLSATSLLQVGAITRGVVAATTTVVLLIRLEAATGGAKRLLSLRPIVYLGRISYGTYLWHWIVILVMAAKVDVSAQATAIFAALVATGLASLSYQLLEMPVREARWLDRRWSGVIAVGLVGSALIGVVVGPAVLESASPKSSQQADRRAVTGLAPVPAALDWEAALEDKGRYPVCRASNTAGCTLVAGGELRVMLIGDSNAKMYTSLLEGLARSRSFTLDVVARPGCYWMRGIVRSDPAYFNSCLERQQEWYDTIVPELDPDIVFLVNRAIDDPVSPIRVSDMDAGELEVGSLPFRDAIERRIAATVAMLRSQGRKVVIIEPTPVTTPKTDPLKCLSLAEFLDACRFVATQSPTQMERMTRAVAESDPGVWSLDFDGLVCPYLPICDPVVDGLIARWDHAHITQTFGRSLVPDVERLLDANDILQER